MSTKTSQLQIRVSPEQKVVLKRLAADAGQSVSAYVLATVLPATQLEFGHRVRAVRSNADRHDAMVELHQYLAGLTPNDFAPTVREVDLEGFPGPLQNQIAAMVEDEARVRGAPSPPWIEAVDEPSHPHFAWELRSLRPHLLQLAPAAYKRRNVYVDATVPVRRTQSHSRELAPLLDLSASLEAEGVLAEVCVLAEAVFIIAFHAKPESRRVRHLFHSTGVARNVVDAVGREHGLAADWLEGVARSAVLSVGAGTGFYEDASLRVYAARPDYTLALRVASLPWEAAGTETARAREDVQRLLRINEATDEQDARRLIAPFFNERQLPDLATVLSPEAAD